MQSVFGMSPEAYEQEVAERKLAKVYIEIAHKLVTGARVPDDLATWKQQARRSNAGTKPLISNHAVFTLFLAHALAGLPVTYTELATTLRLRLKHDERVLLEISHTRGTKQQWYDRIWAAVDRVITLLDPYPAPTNKVLKGTAWSEFYATTQTPQYQANTEAMIKRFDGVINNIVHASLKMLPPDIWERYCGNVAIDATKVEISGHANAATHRGDRSNADPLSGRYRREGDHDGQGAATDVAAYEVETAVMIWNRPDEKESHPSLVTALTMHNPGELRGHGARLLDTHRRLGFDRFIATVDRAYNNGRIEDFHIPARLAGVEFVFEYKKNTLGVQGWYEDLILVDGNWYVNWMPKDLITATAEHRQVSDAIAAASGALTVSTRRDKHTPKQTEADEEHRSTLENGRPLRSMLRDLIADRDNYRMKEHGQIDADGAQRFRYPDPSKSAVAPTPKDEKRASITIPMLVPETDAPSKIALLRPSGSAKKPQPIKNLQKFPYMSKAHTEHKGMRNLVEASNRLLKKGTDFNIADPDQRSGRGFAHTYLAVALAIVANNVHRITSFFNAEEERAVRAAAPKQRARRRKDPNGNPLARREPHVIGPPR
ncbi:MAG: hypothetical protein ABW091_09935 [Microbacterium sp.]